jgi:hypothetical protein
MAISMSGKLPGGDGNGLTAVESRMIDDSNELFVAIAIIDCSKVTINKDTGERTATARARRIEVVLDGEDMRVARRLMMRALDRRTGREALPYSLEEELDSAFGSEDADDYREEPGTTGG